MGANLWAAETYIDATLGGCYGETDPYETSYGPDEIGQLYRAARREHGRCVSRIYRDRADGPPIPCGWVFHKRREYEDAHRIADPKGRTYLAETWVHVYTRGPERTVRTFPADLDHPQNEDEPT